MVRRQRISAGIAALLSLAASLLPASARQSKQTASALAPVKIVMEELGHLRGIAVDGTGAAFVTGSKAGRLWRVPPDGPPSVVMDDLKHPMGVAFDQEGRLALVEAGRRRILRLDADGGTTLLASGMKRPRWVAAAPDGHLYVSAKNLASQDEEDDGDEGEPEVVVRVTPAGRTNVFVDRFRGLQGVAVGEDALHVAARGRKGERHVAGALYEISIEADGRAGPVHPLATNAFAAPAGLALDRLGARFVSARSLAEEPWRGHVIVKVSKDGGATIFAAGLEDPQGLAFGPDGSLYLADGKSGRVLRFLAPRAPSLDEAPPPITNQRQIPLRLRAEAGAQLTVLGGRLPVTAVVGTAGSAVVSVPLQQNAENQLLVFATGGTGLGLTSAPLALSITQDDEPPALELLTPRAGALLRGTIGVEARAADANGVADVEFRLDDLVVGVDAAEPFRVGVDTTVTADGRRVLSALARDRAGNAARAAVSVTVDNTPPEVRIVKPVPGAVAGGPVEVVVEASDLTSEVVQVELAVNGESRFSTEARPYLFRFDLEGIGPFVLVAAAVDRAGNRGESPPVSLARPGITVQITEPGEGAQVPAGLTLVRGRVEASDAEVGVVVNGLPAAVHGTAFAALVLVTPDTTTLTAVATTTTSITASHRVTIAVSGSRASILLPRPQTGVAPLAVAFSLLGAPAGGVALDFDGNGAVDFIGPSLEGQSFTYTQPGLYFPTATITDLQGSRLTVSAIVQVYDQLILDASLQAKWIAFKDTLRSGDVEKALEFLVVNERDGYRPLLTALAPQLGNIDVILRDVAFVSLEENRAEYQMIRTDEGAPLSYLILFLKDDDGIWRLEFF